DAIQQRVAEADAKRKAENAVKLAPFRSMWKTSREVQAKVQADKDAFDKEYRTTTELAYMATNGSQDSFEQLWYEPLRADTPIKVMDGEVARRQRADRKNVRASF